MEKSFVELKGESGVNCFFNSREGNCRYIGLHTHSVIEILYFTGGKHRVICDNTEYITNPGDMLLIRSYTAHELFALSEGDNRHFVIQIAPLHILSLADSNIATSYLLAMSFSNNNSKCLWRRQECEKIGLNKLIEALIDERIKNEYCYDLARASYITQILFILLRETKAYLAGKEEKEELKRRIYDTIVFVQRHFAEDITAEQCAKNVSLSFYYFSRSFKAVTGRTFKEYLNLVRIYHANQLLSSTDKPITEIATDCGFNSVSHFIVTYKKSQNTTPLAYRKATKKT